jgi:23S rRNA pseudouridine2604 synthase
MRLNKYLKDKGLTTRRGADELIASGAVIVNGQKAELGQQVTNRDIVEIKGKNKIIQKKPIYIVYNKPVGVLTNKDAKDTNDILSTTTFKDELGKKVEVFPVGRLDKDSSGLIILTNDGRMTDKLLSPRFKHEKEYIVTLDRAYNDYFIERMQNGVRIDGSITRKCDLGRVSQDTFRIILTEGKKRQIRRMCEALHYDVVALERVRIMNIQLGKMKPGEYSILEGKELKDLLAMLYISKLDAITTSKKEPLKAKAKTKKDNLKNKEQLEQKVKPVSQKQMIKKTEPKRKVPTKLQKIVRLKK